MNESLSIIDETTKYVKETAKKEDRSIPKDFDERVNDLTHHLIESITKRIMRKYHQPKRAITEVTISNIQNHQEGRIDALLEYPNGYALLDWKTYSLNNTISSYEKSQLFSNLLLANYRYTGSEENWEKYLFSSIVHYSSAYYPKYETVIKEKEKILANRNFAYSVLCGEKVQAERPKFCTVCDTNGEGSKECKFYRVKKQSDFFLSEFNIGNFLTKKEMLNNYKDGSILRELNLKIEKKNDSDSWF